MDPIHVNLPQPLREFVDQQVAKGGHTGPEDYIRELDPPDPTIPDEPEVEYQFVVGTLR